MSDKKFEHVLLEYVRNSASPENTPKDVRLSELSEFAVSFLSMQAASAVRNELSDIETKVLKLQLSVSTIKSKDRSFSEMTQSIEDLNKKTDNLLASDYFNQKVRSAVFKQLLILIAALGGLATITLLLFRLYQ